MLSISSNLKEKLDSVTGAELLAISKPWLEKAGRMTGLKSLYDVPEYFRQKLELRGLNVGDYEFSSGLKGATTDLLEKASAPKAPLGDGPSTEVREAINRLNKKLALTKEGAEKGSAARAEMAKILQENRRKKSQNKEETQTQVTNLLDTYTTQKVDGVTAAREAVRTGLTLTGSRALMPMINVAFNGADYVQNLRQLAKQDDADFDPTFVANQLKSSIKNNWDKIKGITDSSKGWDERIQGVEVIENLAEKAGLSSALKLGDFTNKKTGTPKFTPPVTSKGSTRNVKTTTSKSTPSNPSRDSKRPETQSEASSSARDTPQNNQKLSDTNETYPGQNKSRIYNVQTEAKKPTTDELFNAQYSKKGIQPTTLSDKTVGSSRVSKVEAEPRVRPQRTVAPASSQRFGTQRRAKRKANKLAARMAARMRVSGVNSVIFGVGTSLWTFVQLPLAVVSNILFGIAIAAYTVLEAATVANESDGLTLTAVKAFFRGVVALATALSDAISKVFGFDLISALDPFTFFMITYVALFAISIILLFTMYTAYKLARINPLSGKGSGLKHGTLMLAMIGYSLPLANLLPWFMVWAGAVWLKPK